MISIEEQNRFIEREIREWISKDVDPTLKAAIAKREKHIPEGTASELRHDIYKAAGSAFSGYSLSFADAGRITDMKPSATSWSKRPITSDDNFIKRWAKGRGRKYMKRVPGYKSGKAPNLTTDQQLERFASAIITSMPSPSYRRKRRGAWYNRTIYKLINRLIERLSRNQAEYFAGNMGEDIKKKVFGDGIHL